jgi:diguanylate cyclase (GGDEF)-like protein
MQKYHWQENMDLSYQHEIAAEMTTLLYNQAKPAIAGSFIVASCLFYVLYPVINSSYLWGWYGLMIFTTVFRYGLIKIYFSKKQSDKSNKFWNNLFTMAAALAGLGWSFVSVLSIPTGSVYETFSICSLAAMAAGAIPFFSCSRAACVVFVVPILLPCAIAAFLDHDTPHQLLGFLAFLYLNLLLIACFRMHNTFYRVIKLKFENEMLVGNLQESHKVVENYLSTHDGLTDLPNRHLFNLKLEKAIVQAEHTQSQLALLFLDLDHFKDINDALGHDLGDSLLIKVVERIQSCLSETDFLARFGGDEFTLILENSNSQSVVSRANTIRNKLALPFQLNEQDYFITTSIGIALYPDDGSDMQMLVKNADMATYRAKERGRNTSEFYTQEMNEKIIKKMQIANDLRSALENNELAVYYQPVIDVSSSAIISFEAVLRWLHPVRGFISPVEFIPVAEEVGLIIPIGEWVLKSVCEQHMIWQKLEIFPINLRIAVNLSARQFAQNNLIEMIATILKETGLYGQYLTLELTESLIMQDVNHSIDIIKTLKQLGISISIDDFGTGYSSLNYLRKFPIDILKIDRSFVTDISGENKSSDEAAAIIKAIIAMAHSLKMKVIAEGVETSYQYRFLKNHDCDEIQGFIFAKPMPAAKVPVFLQKNLTQAKIESHLNQ